ncbi:hypothetical protein QC761_507055 [Podospora bellae-mahoneyi]|uniref:Uncharacterized protein n=1 Tax=Podospora bellae-mahoneyi TaxID=2093777 RepID=A0ABR0FE12_9PEZI|nr:hypothetical protein QC761_507055 [Podospora bellae-mahoneyi]
MSSAKDKLSGIPVPSNPATTSPTATTSPIHRRSSVGSQTGNNSKGTRVKFEEGQQKKPEAAEDKKPKVVEEDAHKSPNVKPGEEPKLKPQTQGEEKKPDLPKPKDNDSNTDNDDPFRFATVPDELLPTGLPPIEEDEPEEEEEDVQSFSEDPYYLQDDQQDVYSFTTPPTSPDFPPGNPPMVSSSLRKTLNEDFSPPLPPYLLLRGTLILLGTLTYGLLNSTNVTSLTALLFPGIQLLLSGIVLSLVDASQPSDPVTPGWKVLVQLATVVEWLYFLLELHQNFYDYSAPGAYLHGGYGIDFEFGSDDPADYGTLDNPKWPHEAKVKATRGRGLNLEGRVLEGVDRFVGVAAGVGWVLIWFVVARAVWRLRNAGGAKRRKRE